MNYDKILNSRVMSLPPSGIRRFFDIVNEMPGAISLGVGEPDFVTPWGIRDAAIKSIQKGFTQYSSNWGLLELRQEISGYLSSRFNLHYNAKNEIFVTVGASEAIDLALRAIINPGEEVLIPDPSYVSYSPIVTLVGGVPVPVETDMEHEFKLTLDQLEKAVTDKTKALILPYPNNPTGGIMDKSDLEKIRDFIIKHDLIVLSDEIYAELTYGGEHVSIAAFEGFRERTILINGFSKAFAMTGWRIGFVASVPEIIKQMVKIHQYTIMCASTNSQYAAYFALKDGKTNDYEAVTDMRTQYDSRRRYLVSEFRDMGLDVFEPKGAFYVFPSVERFHMTGEEFAEKLLYEQKVAVVPGSAFGESGKYHIRCCYACSIKNIKEACRRIRNFIQNLPDFAAK